MRIFLNLAASALVFVSLSSATVAGPQDSHIALQSSHFAEGTRTLQLRDFFFETEKGKVAIPLSMDAVGKPLSQQISIPDGRALRVSVKPDGDHFAVRFEAQPSEGITKWGFSVDAEPAEYFTGLMERVVDGPQRNSWARGVEQPLNLRGQKVDMILKPTMSVYAPYYISSRGYGLFVKGNWPGLFDLCASDTNCVKIEFEGPSLEFKVYAAKTPTELVTAHALDAGPPFMAPKWMYRPWRWRDENTQRPSYYDGTRVTGPFNSEAMEDILLMKAYGISCGIYWLDRPWGPGRNGYDDFEIDSNRFPHFQEMVKWLSDQDIHTVLWIGPFFQGRMETNALQKHYTLACQKRTPNNYPMADFTNPEAKKYWQDGVAKLLKMGVAGFKLDRSEEEIPESGPYKVFDGRTIRENRNAYPPMYVKAAYDVAKEYRGEDFFCMPRAAYTGSSAYGVFWGGDIGGVQEGLRAEIIAVQRAAVMGYPNWGSDTGGYNEQSMDTEVVGRWLGFSCFTPIMEVGPTKNRAFWDFHNPPSYDAELIAIWRLYARLHTRLADYSYAAAQVAHESGLPIVRPLFLVDPNAPAAWSNWWTYQYGPDLVVSPVWKKNQRTQEVYLPSGARWGDAWHPGKVYDGGQTITVQTELHQMPLFVHVGAKVDVGDLNAEWTDAVAAANMRPDLKTLDAGIQSWFNERVASK
jgi:alpha-glucosidase (family GH31 glycosyl hydrolase)